MPWGMGDVFYTAEYWRDIADKLVSWGAISLMHDFLDDHHVLAAEPGNHEDNLDHCDPFFWKHAIFSSAFYGGVGIWPSRDNIQTIADPNAFEGTLLANLLGGAIQLGQRLGECNFELLKKTYRGGDGLILKPSRPIAPIDRCYHLAGGGALGFSQTPKNRD
jgi:hypothetical protein